MNSKKSSVIKTIFYIILVIIYIIVTFPCHCGRVLFLPDGIYINQSDDTTIICDFDYDNDILDVYTLFYVDEHIRYCALNTYKTSSQGFVHYTGDLYITIMSSSIFDGTPLALLSLRHLKYGNKSGYIYLKAQSSMALDIYNIEYMSLEQKDQVYEITIFDDCFYIGMDLGVEDKYEKIDSIPLNLQIYLDLMK